jgi:CO/xanthine dehydrogenase FAD-binding subunit
MSIRQIEDCLLRYVLVRQFSFRWATSIEQAVDWLAQGNVKLLAGGTDLVVALRADAIQPDLVVDVNRIPELKAVRQENGRIAIGAAVTFGEIARHRLLLEQVPFLAQAAATVGSPQIRGAGALGGNIANGSPAADCVVPLVALDADVLLVSKAGRRVAPLREVLQAPPNAVNIGKDELIVSVSFAAPPAGARGCFVKLGRRNALSVARLSCAVMGRLNGDGVVELAAVALGAVAPHPFRAAMLERMLLGERPGPDLLRRIVEASSDEIARVLGTRASMPYKSQAIKGVIWEALEGCFLV